MAQSQNNSFAEIIVEESREREETKTLIENSEAGSSKPYGSEGEPQPESELQGSMICIDSQRSEFNSCTSETVITGTHKEIDKEPINVCSNNTLANYINGMKQMCNVEMKCVEMLVNTINNYDKQLTETLNKIFQEYKNKV
jgi:hypothetical protein